jgi:hypothetical protein
MKAVLNNAKTFGIIVARNPGLSVFGVLSLALAIAANTSVFNVVNAMTLIPHCTQEPDRLVTVLTNHPASGSDHCDGVDLVESPRAESAESKGENTAFECSVLAAEALESGFALRNCPQQKLTN